MALILGALAIFAVSAGGGGRYFDLPPAPPAEEFGRVVIDRASTAAGQKPVVFSHWSHRLRYTCRVCHFELGFEMRGNATEITEARNRAGEYCGACHDGKVAFGHVEGECRKCHGDDRKAMRRRFRDLDLPAAPHGNGIDWVAAVESAKIDPKQSVLDERFEPIPFAKQLELGAKWAMIPPAVFPHREHQRWLDCANCHPDIFNIKAKTTEHFEMRYILESKFCGVCHLKVAFPLDDCVRCHPAMR